jgi:hypothetical protein
MKKITLFCAILIFVALTLNGCSWPWSNKNTTNTSTTMMPGSDRDAHGCIPSAGYSWCEAKQKCLRTWEETCQ